MARADKRSPASCPKVPLEKAWNVARAPISGLFRQLYVGQTYSAV